MNPIVTKKQIITGLHKLGLEPGQVVMLHASVKSIGWVVGGPDVVIAAILDVLGPEGTLMMLVGTEDGTYEMADWPEEKRRAYLEECPPFDPDRTRAYRKWSILTEYLRTWPGAFRSGHPDASFAAVGKLAKWITEEHPLQYGHGPGSPLAKLCEAEGKVLLLGAPFASLTILHLSEHMARVPDKRIVNYRAPMLRDGRKVWVSIEEFDTCELIGDWEGEGYFDIIPAEALKAGIGVQSKVGAADSFLFDAAKLNEFAIKWLETNIKAD